MNLASIWKLPVVFVCENNGYAQATPVEYAVAADRISDRAAAYRMPGVTVDGQDVLAVYAAAEAAVERARAGGGPSFVECMTYRYYGHHQGDETLRYRTADEERAGARARLPAPPARVPRSTQAFRCEAELDAIDARNRGRLDEAIAFAEASPLPGPEQLLAGRLRGGSRLTTAVGLRESGEARELTFSQAINDALRLAMRRDPTVIVLGEDIAGAAGRAHLGLSDAWGGPLRATRGLIGEFGPERVIDTPISEMAFVGAAVGAAMTGLRPVVEIMFVDLIGCCYDQIINQAAKMHYMMGGQVDLPLVIRTAYGMHGFKRSYGGGAAAQHSQTLYSVLAHVPGLKVVVPVDGIQRQGPHARCHPRQRPGRRLRAQVPRGAPQRGRCRRRVHGPHRPRGDRPPREPTSPSAASAA